VDILLRNSLTVIPSLCGKDEGRRKLLKERIWVTAMCCGSRREAQIAALLQQGQFLDPRLSILCLARESRRDTLDHSCSLSAPG
jgi:hypothetical protein